MSHFRPSSDPGGRRRQFEWNPTVPVISTIKDSLHLMTPRLALHPTPANSLIELFPEMAHHPISLNDSSEEEEEEDVLTWTVHESPTSPTAEDDSPPTYPTNTKTTSLTLPLIGSISLSLSTQFIQLYIHPAHRDRGFATESLKRVLEVAFISRSTIPQVFIQTRMMSPGKKPGKEVNDGGLQRVAEKIGMTRVVSMGGVWGISKKEFLELWGSEDA
jgi:hypothetical protein